MKLITSTLERIEIECAPESLDEAIQEIQARGYFFKKKKRKRITGGEFWYLVGEKKHECDNYEKTLSKY